MTRAAKERGLKAIGVELGQMFSLIMKDDNRFVFEVEKSGAILSAIQSNPENFDAEEKTTEQIIKIWGGSSPLYRARDFIKKTNLQAELMKLNPKPVLGVGWAEDLRKLFFEFYGRERSGGNRE